jgi:NarL family two-component system response regulator LiaR
MSDNNNSSTEIRVLIVDDHDMVRQGMETFLKAYDDLELVGQAADGAEAIQLSKQLCPDVIVMDLILPDMAGPEVIRAILESQPDVRVLALSSFQTPKLIREALQAGVIGYLTKDVSTKELADAIRAAKEGKPTLAPEAYEVLVRSTSRVASSRYNLTDRERDVLSLMVEGQTNRQIAQNLSVSLSTVKFHVSSILAKLSVSSRTEAVALAMQHDLV